MLMRFFSWHLKFRYQTSIQALKFILLCDCLLQWPSYRFIITGVGCMGVLRNVWTYLLNNFWIRLKSYLIRSKFLHCLSFYILLISLIDKNLPYFPPSRWISSSFLVSNLFQSNVIRLGRYNQVWFLISNFSKSNLLPSPKPINSVTYIIFKSVKKALHFQPLSVLHWIIPIGCSQWNQKGTFPFHNFSSS